MFKLTENVITIVDYLLCMLIPNTAYKTLSVLGSKVEAKEWMEPIVEKIGQLVDASSQVSSESSNTPATEVSKYFAGLNRKIKCSQQEAYLQQYAMLPDAPDNPAALPPVLLLAPSSPCEVVAEPVSSVVADPAPVQ